MGLAEYVGRRRQLLQLLLVCEARSRTPAMVGSVVQ